MNRKQRRGEKKQGRPVPPGASPRVQDVLADALRHHQAGRLNEARNGSIDRFSHVACGVRVQFSRTTTS
jgi:hypothetical protein